MTSTPLHVSRASIRAVHVAYFLNALLGVTWMPRIPMIKDALELSNGQLGRMLMFGGLSGVFFSKPAGHLVKKYSSKRILLWFVPINLSSAILIGCGTTQPMFIGGLLISGFGFLLIYTSLTMQASTISHFTGSNALNKLTAVATIGALVAVAIGAATLTVFTTPQYIVGLSGLTLIGFLACNPFLIPEDFHEPATQEQIDTKLPWFSKQVLPLYILIFAMSASGFAEFSANDWASIYARDDLAISAPYYALPFVCFQAAIVIIRLSLTRIGRRFDNANLVRTLALTSAVAWTSGMLVAVRLAQTSPWTALAVASLSFAVAGVGIGPIYPSLMGAVELPGFAKPLVLARMFSISTAFFIFGPGFMGTMAQFVGLKNAILLAPALLLVSGVLSFRVLRNHEDARELKKEQHIDR